MGTLNVVNKSPFEKRSLEQCMSRANNGDSVLLIEDAAIAAVSGNDMQAMLSEASGNVNLYVLKPDLDARGFANSTVTEAFSQVDYAGFVELVVSHDRVHSWL